MYKIDAYIANAGKPTAIIKQLDVKRDWMGQGIYNCTPLISANPIGYGIYFDKDLSFIWDGDPINPARILKGEEYLNSDRGGGAISFNTNLILKTDANTSILTIPVPNQPIKDITVLSTVLSTSFFSATFTMAWKLEIPNKEYTIKAGTPVACIMPISMSQYNNSVLNIHNTTAPFPNLHGKPEYIKALKNSQKAGKFLRLYQKGFDQDNNSIGTHEVKKLVLNINYINEEVKK
jgi:hypothetical protein